MNGPGTSRREFLGLAAGAGLAAAGARLARSPLLVRAAGGPDLGAQPFTLGIASGEPLPDGVVLWTRLAPEPQVPGGGVPPEPVPVRWEVARDERFAQRVARGVVRARPEHAHAVHVDVRGLDPGRDYFYRFVAGDATSPTGRTRTTPAASSPAPVSFAFASCQDYTDGYYTAHRHLADDDVDVVLWLGDYIYEGGVGSGVRQHEGPEPTDLEGYRRRYATYKSDADLQASHAAHPWIVTWDDHEVDNNYADDRSQRDDQPVEAFRARRATAYRVWWEHQPVRLPPPTGPDYRIYRRAALGGLATVHMLDTRQYRTDQPCGSPVDFGVPCTGQDDPAATLLGAEQRAWLFDGLRRSRARWDLLGQQIMFSAVSFSPDPAIPVVNFDQWDGYKHERAEVTTALGRLPRNGVVLTGDIHSSWVNDIVADPTRLEGTSPQAVATELVGTSITSSFPLPDVIDAAVVNQPTVKYANARSHGYVRCRVTRDALRADFRHVSAVDTPDATISTAASFVVHDREPGARPT